MILPCTTHHPPPFYQGYDKAMDVYYLGIAYVATLRNWSAMTAAITARALFFYRQVGVVLFELLQLRVLLLVFANTFEYFLAQRAQADNSGFAHTGR